MFNKVKTYHFCPHHIMWCVHTNTNCDKVKGQDVKQKATKKKIVHGRKGGEKSFSELVDYFLGINGDGNNNDNSNQG